MTETTADGEFGARIAGRVTGLPQAGWSTHGSA
jgi:hypothetical protein